MDPRIDRAVAARTRPVVPRVTVERLAAAYPHVITVDRDRFRLHYFRNLRRVKTYRVAIGRAGYDTPTGVLVERALAHSRKGGIVARFGRTVVGTRRRKPLRVRVFRRRDGCQTRRTRAWRRAARVRRPARQRG
jgi:ethanolamine ammonia-lyase small subunit